MTNHSNVYSGYFTVKDVEAFRKDMPQDIYFDVLEDKYPNCVSFATEETDMEELSKIIMPHLIDNEICLLSAPTMTIENGLIIALGVAYLAFNNKGESQEDYSENITDRLGEML